MIKEGPSGLDLSTPFGLHAFPPAQMENSPAHEARTLVIV
jgi:hypothetical protein